MNTLENLISELREAKKTASPKIRHALCIDIIFALKAKIKIERRKATYGTIMTWLASKAQKSNIKTAQKISEAI